MYLVSHPVARLVRLHRVDGLFSTYKPDSAISRIRVGRLSPEAADPLVVSVLERCRQ